MDLLTHIFSLSLLCSVGVALVAQPRSQVNSVPLKRIGMPSRGSYKAGSTSITNMVNGYSALTKVGTQTFELLVDTGSGNTWAGGGTNYIPGPTAHNTGRDVSVSYGFGNFSGMEFMDNVSIGDVTVQQQSIGDATSSFGFPGLDGILGVGPPDLTNNTVTGVGIFSTFMESGNETAAVNGLLTFGGVDMTNCPGPITYTPRSRVSPYSKFWGIDIESTSYGSTVLSAGSNAIVDTGTTLILIADQDFQIFLSLTGGSFDANIGIPSFEMRPTLVFTFKINGVEFPLTPDQYLIPDAELADLGLSPGIWGWISTSGPSPDDGILVIMGFSFLLNYCSIFDADYNVIGLGRHA